MAAAHPPLFDDCSPVCQTPEAKKRFAQLGAKFFMANGAEAAFVARAPGRVNLIGEHIDYSGYAVLPMAIDQDFLIAVRPRGQEVKPKILRVSNVLSKFPSREMASWPVEIDDSKHDWINYFLAGYRGMIEFAKLSQDQIEGMEVLVDGSVPPGAGLSSSSAFVVAAALATMQAHQLQFEKETLAAMCAKAEHYVGTEGGGMDQSISFLAEAGKAKLIEFNPIRAHDVILPEDGVFVISNSCVEANKYVTAGSCYNKRVVECRAAAMLLAKAAGLDKPIEYRKLKQVQDALNKSLDEMAEFAASQLNVTYTKEELATALGLSVAEVDEKVLSPSTVAQTEFSLQARAKHVYSEAARVWKFKEASTLQELGTLMNQSHESCRDLYECSCPELDELTEICREAGAFGSRLTGAGWGGCAVSLVAADKVGAFLAEVKEKFFMKDQSRMANIEKNLFATRPAQGAAIIKTSSFNLYFE